MKNTSDIIRNIIDSKQAYAFIELFQAAIHKAIEMWNINERKVTISKENKDAVQDRFLALSYDNNNEIHYIKNLLQINQIWAEKILQMDRMLAGKFQTTPCTGIK